MQFRSLVMCMVMASVTGTSLAQVVPPPPARTPPSPEFTPPPPPPTPAATPRPPTTDNRPATPEAPLPTLIEKDAEGRIRPLTMPAEEAAVRALKPNDETMTKVEASLVSRRDDLDRLILQNIGVLVELRDVAAKVNDKTSVDDLQSAGKKATPFRTFNSVLDRLSRDGAIDTATKNKAARVAREYTQAYETDMVKGVDHGNYQAMIPLAFKRFMHSTSSEAFAALDRQLAAAAPKMEQLFDGINLPPTTKTDVAGRLRGLPKAGNADADARRFEALKGVFYEVLTNEQRAAFLLAANPKLGEAKAEATEGATK